MITTLERLATGHIGLNAHSRIIAKQTHSHFTSRNISILPTYENFSQFSTLLNKEPTELLFKSPLMNTRVLDLTSVFKRIDDYMVQDNSNEIIQRLLKTGTLNDNIAIEDNVHDIIGYIIQPDDIILHQDITKSILMFSKVESANSHHYWRQHVGYDTYISITPIITLSSYMHKVYTHQYEDTYSTLSQLTRGDIYHLNVASQHSLPFVIYPNSLK